MDLTRGWLVIALVIAVITQSACTPKSVAEMFAKHDMTVVSRPAKGTRPYCPVFYNVDGNLLIVQGSTAWLFSPKNGAVAKIAPLKVDDRDTCLDEDVAYPVEGKKSIHGMYAYRRQEYEEAEEAARAFSAFQENADELARHVATLQPRYLQYLRRVEGRTVREVGKALSKFSEEAIRNSVKPIGNPPEK